MIALACAALSLASTAANAATTTTLKQVQVNNGSQVDLLFDGRIGKNQIRTEFFNDVIQIILSDAAVYPAKISSVQGGDLTKIFAYQYAPKLVRCRLTVKGKAESYKDKIQITTQGRILSVRLDGVATDRISIASAAAQRVGAKPAVEAAKSAVVSGPKEAEADERALLDRVTRGEAAPQALVTAPEPVRQKAAQPPAPLASGKPLPGMLSTFGKLCAVLAIFLGLAFAARRLMAKMGGKPNSQLIGAISKFAGVARKPKMIDVISSHYLGPKKSICVVKIAGRTLVLGVTNESINLITQLNGDISEAELVGELGGDFGDLLSPTAKPQQPQARAQVQAQPYAQAPSGTGAVSAGPAIFSDVLGNERSKPALPANNVRSQIKSKLEGYKSL